VCPGRRAPPLRLRSPLKAPGLTVSRFRPFHGPDSELQQDKHAINIRLIYHRLRHRIVDNSRFLWMHRVQVALSQVKALSWVRPCSGIPSISTRTHRLSAVAHNSSTCLCTASKGSSPLAALAGRCGSARQRLPDTASTPDPRLQARARMRSRKNADLRCTPPLGRRARRPRAHCFRLRRGRPGTSPVTWVIARDLGHRGWHSGGLPACRSWHKTFPPGRIRQGPPMYEMGGPCPASPRQAGQLPGLASAARRRRCRVPARGTGLQAPPTSPGSPPGGARFQR
jgi:hypothetical protein